MGASRYNIAAEYATSLNRAGISLTVTDSLRKRTVVVPTSAARASRVFGSLGLSPILVQRKLAEVSQLHESGVLPKGSTIDLNLDLTYIKPGEVIISVGGQGGDEGKGKQADILAQSCDMVVRCTGGNNARYTFAFDGKEFQLRHVPLGIVDPAKTCIIAPGMYNDSAELIMEIESLKSQGIHLTPRNLKIATQGKVVLPIFRLLSRLRDEANASIGTKIGTTSKGTGPAVASTAAKRGIRFCDLLGRKEDESATDRMRQIMEECKVVVPSIQLNEDLQQNEAIFKRLMKRTYCEELLKLLSIMSMHKDFSSRFSAHDRDLLANLIKQSETKDARAGAPQIWDELTTAAKPLAEKIFGKEIKEEDIFFDPQLNTEIEKLCMDILKPYFHATTGRLIQKALDEGKKVLLQSVQGTLISPTAGVYPYTGGADSVAPSALTGALIGHHNISRVHGAIKAYQTLSGGGLMPFPTEIKEGVDLSQERIDRIRELGGERGVTLGGRRMGWLDIPVLRYSQMVNGITDWTLTHLDPLQITDIVRRSLLNNHLGTEATNEVLGDLAQRGYLHIIQGSGEPESYTLTPYFMGLKDPSELSLHPSLSDMSHKVFDLLRRDQTIKICVDYELPNGSLMGPDNYRAEPQFLRSIRPRYITMPGWYEDISGIRSFDHLPLNAQLYVKKVAELTGTRVSIIGLGKDREQTIQQAIMPSGNVGATWK